MDILIDKIDKFNPNSYCTLIYGKKENQYYIKIVDIEARDPIKTIKINFGIDKPKYISEFTYLQNTSLSTQSNCLGGHFKLAQVTTLFDPFNIIYF